MKNKSISRFTGIGSDAGTQKHKVTDEDLQKELSYEIVTQAIQSLLDNGLISQGEFDKIDANNRQTFSPHLAVLFAENR